MTAALLLLLVGWSRVALVDKVFEIPAGQWRYWDHTLNGEPAVLGCQFDSTPGARVRVVLVSRTELAAWVAGRDHEEIGATAPGSRGTLQIPVHEPDAYVVIDNRGARPANVRLRVFLEEPPVRHLSRQRQLAVIAISFAVFFAIVSLSARKLLQAARRQ
jgi:hypothetical protein